MKQVLATVVSNKKVPDEYIRPDGREVLGTWLMWLHCPDIAREVRPGQFVMVYCGEETWLRRPLSVHQVDGAQIALLYSVIGKGTHWLSQQKAMSSIDLFGPLGNGFSVNSDSQELLLLAGGIGIAPIYFLAQESLKQGHQVILLYGTADKKRCPVPAGIKVVSATEDGSVGYKGMLTELLPEYVNKADQIFACGPVAMYREMASKYRQILKDTSIQISLEVRMGCGFGVCYGCTVKTKNGLKQVCQNGPVFDLHDILWDEFRC